MFFLEVKRRELAGVWIASWKVWIATSRQFRPQAVLRSGAGSEVLCRCGDPSDLVAQNGLKTMPLNILLG